MKTFPTRPEHQRRGSILIVALIFCAVIGISLVSYYKLASTALKGANRSVLSFSNINIAEIGIEQGMSCFHAISTGVAAATAWDGWTLNTGTNEATRTYGPYTVGPNATGVVKI